MSDPIPADQLPDNDGAPVLIFCADAGEWSLGYWDAETSCWYTHADLPLCGISTPTYWMPLPFNPTPHHGECTCPRCQGQKVTEDWRCNCDRCSR